MNDGDVSAEKVSSSNSNNDDSNSNDDDDILSNELSNMNIHSRKSSRHCLYCLKQVEGSLRCSKCRTALYCGQVCQEKHLSVHKNICKDSNNTEDADEKLHMKAMNHLDQGNSIQTTTCLLIHH